jgi:hypothetical protein
MSACAASDPPSPLSAAPPLAAVVEGSSVIAVLAPDSTGIAGSAKRAVNAMRADGVAVARSLGVVDAEPGPELSDTLAAIGRLLDEDPVLMIVGCDREVAFAAARMAAEAGVLMMSPCVTAPQFNDDRHAGYSLMATNRQQGNRIAREVMARGYESAVVISDVASVDAYAQCKGFVDRFVESGGDLHGEFALGSLVEQAVWPLKRHADVVVSCAGQADAASAGSTIRALYDGPIMAGSAAMQLLGEKKFGDVSVVASLDVDARWTFGAATRGLVEIFGGVAQDARSFDVEVLSAAIDDTSVFETSIGRVQFDSRRNAAPINVRRNGDGQVPQ